MSTYCTLYLPNCLLFAQRGVNHTVGEVEYHFPEESKRYDENDTDDNGDGTEEGEGNEQDDGRDHQGNDGDETYEEQAEEFEDAATGHRPRLLHGLTDAGIVVLNEVETALPQTDAEIHTGDDEEDGAEDTDEDVEDVPQYEVDIDLGGNFHAVKIELVGAATYAEDTVVEGHHDHGADDVL